MAQELITESFPRRARNRQNGFTLVEALIVVVIGMILTAFAVPMVQSALRSYTINSVTSNLSGMVQQARYAAINQGLDACTVLVGNQFGVDANCNGALAATPLNPEIRILIPRDVSLSQNSPISTAPGTGMPFLPDPTPFNCASFAVTFNSRGTKKSVCGNATGVPATHILFVTGWGNTNAVTITGTGRAKSWRWDGAMWR